MDYYKDQTGSDTRPDYNPSGGKKWAVEFDPVTGNPASVIRAGMFNSIIATLMHTIEEAGLTGDDADDSLLTKAIKKLSPVTAILDKLANAVVAIPDYSDLTSYAVGTTHTALESGIIVGNWSVSGSQSGQKTCYVEGRPVFDLNKSYQNATTSDRNWAIVGKGQTFNLASGNTSLMFYPFKKGI